MATQLQVTANQINAQLSTGPRTDQGKQNSSRNALNHGLASPFCILHHESREEFDRMLASYIKDCRPATEHERFLVEQMADARFRMARAARLEKCLYNIDTGHVRESRDFQIVQAMIARGGNPYDRLHRYRVSAERTYHRCHKELVEAQKQRAGEDRESRIASERAEDRIRFRQAASFCKTEFPPSVGSDPHPAHLVPPAQPDPSASFCKSAEPQKSLASCRG